MSHVSRARQWTKSEHNSAHRYYDFREHPELITEVLEDFRPHQDQAAVREFYQLLANINAEASEFETNDCALNPPAANISSNVSAREMQTAGRLMFFFRRVHLNLNRTFIEWLEEGVHLYLAQLTPELEEGVVGTSIMKMHMPELGSEHAPAVGFELCLHFWAWGDTSEQTWSNLHVVVHNIHQSLAALSRDAGEERYLSPSGGA